MLGREVPSSCVTRISVNRSPPWSSHSHRLCSPLRRMALHHITHRRPNHSAPTPAHCASSTHHPRVKSTPQRCFRASQRTSHNVSQRLSFRCHTRPPLLHTPHSTYSLATCTAACRDRARRSPSCSTPPLQLSSLQHRARRFWRSQCNWWSASFSTASAAGLLLSAGICADVCSIRRTHRFGPASLICAYTEGSASAVGCTKRMLVRECGEEEGSRRRCWAWTKRQVELCDRATVGPVRGKRMITIDATAAM